MSTKELSRLESEEVIICDLLEDIGRPAATQK